MTSPRSPLLPSGGRQSSGRAFWIAVAFVLTLGSGSLFWLIGEMAVRDARQDRELDGLYRYNSRLYSAGGQAYISSLYLSEIVNQQNAEINRLKGRHAERFF